MQEVSIENIHKVISPLFLEDLQKEFDSIRAVSYTHLDVYKRQVLVGIRISVSSMLKIRTFSLSFWISCSRPVPGSRIRYLKTWDSFHPSF